MEVPSCLLPAPYTSPPSCGHQHHTPSSLATTIPSIQFPSRFLRRTPPYRLLLSSFSSSPSSSTTLSFKPLKLHAASNSTATRVRVTNVEHAPDVSFSFLLRRLDQEDAALQARQLLALSVKLSVCFDHVSVANKLILLLARGFLLEDARQLFVRIPRRSVMIYHSLISSYCERQLWDGAFGLFVLMVADGCLPDKSLLRMILKACSLVKSLELGRMIHGYAMRKQLDLNVFVCGALVEMYAKCGSLDGARNALIWTRKCLWGDGRRLRKEMSDKGAIVYAPLITSYCREQQWLQALGTLALMVADGFLADKFLLPSVLKACSEIESLSLGMMIHGYLIRRELEFDVFIGNALIDMYVKCGRLNRARKAFDVMPLRDVVSWTVMISAYAEVGLLDEAMLCFELMVDAGVQADVIAWNALIAGSAKFGDLHMALELLDEMRMSGLSPGVSSWNGIISGCVCNGYAEDALLVFRQMRLSEKPNTITISSILAALSDMNFLQLGKEVHAYAIRCAMETNVFINGSILGMYLKCGKRECAQKIFESMSDVCPTVWNEMIASYANDGDLERALEFLNRMRSSGVEPDVVTYNTLLASYARAGEKDQAFKRFSEMISLGLKPNIVTFNVLISGFQQCGQTIEALKLFQCMQLSSEITPDGCLSAQLHTDGQSKSLFHHATRLGLQPDAITLTSALAACADLKRQMQGKQIHAYVLRNWLEQNVFLSSALVDMYAKCQDMSSATKTFCRIVDKNTVCWNCLIAGCNQNAQPESSLKLFSRMLEDGVMLSAVTIILLLSACSSTVALRLGRELHGSAMKFGFYRGSALASALIDMYAKCGSIKEARQVFDRTTARDAALWNVMISGYAMHGMARDAVNLFQEMESSGVKPDHITFTSVLSACGHGGLVQEGWAYFTSMEKVYEITPTLEHYTCMIGILGRVGLLNESQELIRKMPFEPDACLWSTLLQACRIHSNVKVGEEAARALFQLEPTNAASYIVLANIYATAGMWDLSMKVRKWMEKQGITTAKESSWIEMNQMTKFFEAGDPSHPEMEEILETWDKLAAQMEENGYFPCDICPEELDIGSLDPFSCYHTERLALCYGIITSPNSRSPIHVVKNLRMCIDCHTSTKFISQVIGRDILVKDGCFYHHFSGGNCSCNDKW
ncbi:pentatricopeptide repeat-containing protein At2g22070-like [Nymphaea colorata]|uniref:DYW domain-containing protein n=1 Tax=Nymphaea colorata TaxID=210225 RepID=A0A5K0Z0P7_9MAGN|nr:pentatricopeptide repeat-containing protein At2g22070-like [Nymphaea colorata]